MTPTEEEEAWNALVQVVDMWEANKPYSFLPVACNDPEPEQGRWFPEISFGSEWHGLSYVRESPEENLFSLTIIER